jgi:hypothetical protein
VRRFYPAVDTYRDVFSDAFLSNDGVEGEGPILSSFWKMGMRLGYT